MNWCMVSNNVMYTASHIICKCTINLYMWIDHLFGNFQSEWWMPLFGLLSLIFRAKNVFIIAGFNRPRIKIYLMVWWKTMQKCSGFLARCFLFMRFLLWFFVQQSIERKRERERGEKTRGSMLEQSLTVIWLIDLYIGTSILSFDWTSAIWFGSHIENWRIYKYTQIQYCDKREYFERN